MKRNVLLTLTALLLAPLAVLHAADAAKPNNKPNIIFILADDLGIPGVGCYGGVFKTPSLDSLAAGGTRFEHCFSAPLCAPSRAMLMTGRYAFRTGVTSNHTGAEATPQKDGCVAQLMKQAGYATALAGKWRQLTHLSTKEDSAKWGFDEFLTWGADDDESKGDRYWNPDYNLNGGKLKDTNGKYGPDVLNDFAIDFIRRHKEGPFFLYYPTPLVHEPLERTPDGQATKTSGKGKLKKAGSSLDALYADNIAYFDKLVGQLVAELDALHLREKTLIVVSGDNGSVPIGTVNSRPVDGKKHGMNEGGSRVPLIANWRGVTPAGVVLKDLVDFTDMLPTFAELGGASLPTDRTIDGHSYAPQLRGEKGTPREWAYVQLGEKRYVRSEGWKLTDGGKLYDMSDAPFAEKPVSVETDASKDARAKLQAALAGLHDDSAPEKPLSKKAMRKAAK